MTEGKAHMHEEGSKQQPVKSCMNERTRRGDSQVSKEKGRYQLLATTPGPPQASIQTSSAIQPDTSAVLCPSWSREYGRVSCKLGLFPQRLT